MKGKSGTVKPRIMMLDDKKANRTYKRSSVEPWLENVGETRLIEPTFKQNTNYDDEVVEDLTILSFISSSFFKFISAIENVRAIVLLTGLPFRTFKDTKGLQKIN